MIEVFLMLALGGVSFALGTQISVLSYQKTFRKLEMVVDVDRRIAFCACKALALSERSRTEFYVGQAQAFEDVRKFLLDYQLVTADQSGEHDDEARRDVEPVS